MLIATDLEGVLVPEIWLEIARATGVDGLAATTGEVADFDRLMERRMRLLAEHDLRLPDLQAIAASLRPFPGAAELVARERSIGPTIVVSDAFHELAEPLIRELGAPPLFGNAFRVDGEGRIRGCRLRIGGRKDRVVRPLREIGFRVVAIGDGYNDERMFRAADHAILFRAPDALAERISGGLRATNYEDVQRILEDIHERISQGEVETV